MNLAEGILSTAQAIGANPLDLATVISYETGGTFDPLQLGPVTQHGQHRGLIQFGEPQAAQYGVNWADPLGSQLGPNGAVANYLRGSGYQPGMGLLDLYSTINAGAPGRYNASDANNGGAPGTVADKVNEQMAGHRRNAEQLLGQMMAGQQGQPMQQQPGGLLATTSTMNAPQEPSIWDAIAGRLPEPIGNRLRDPDWRARMGIALAGMSHRPNQGIIESLQSGIDDRAESERINQTVQWLSSIGRNDLAEAVVSGALIGSDAAAIAMRPEQATQVDYSQVPQYGVDANGNPVMIQVGDDGTAVQTALPEGVTLSREPIRIDAGTDIILLDPITRQQIGVIPKNTQEAAAQAALGQQQGTAQGQAETALPGVIAAAGQALGVLNQVLDPANADALGSITGNVQGRIPAGVPFVTGGQEGADLGVKLDQVQGQVFLTAYDQLRGAGAITEQEGDAARAAIARLNRVQSTEEFRSALEELRGIINSGIQRAQAKADGGIAATPLPPSSTEITGTLERTAPTVINGYSIQEVP